MQISSRTAARLLVPLAMVSLLGTAACSGGEEDAADDDVATLGADDGSGDDSSGDDADDDGGGGEGGRPIDPEFQDALLEFAECMRDHGIDMPDPQFEDGGAVVSMGAAPGSDGGPPSAAQEAEMEAADEACRPIMEAVEGSMPEPDPEQIQEMQDQALEFAECMREHGIDMPDPEFGEGGRMTQTVGDPAGGVDFSDEEFQEAAEECGGEGGFGVSIGGADVGDSGSDDGEDG